MNMTLAMEFITALLLSGCLESTTEPSSAEASAGHHGMIVPDGGRCSLASDACQAVGTARCCPLEGDAFVYESARGCRKQVASVSDPGPIACFDTGKNDGTCVLYTVEACFARDEADGTITVVFSTSDYDNGYIDSTGLKKCETALKAAVTEAPACPE